MRVAMFTETFLPKVDGIVSVVKLTLDHLNSRGIETMVIAPRLGSQLVTQYNAMPVVTVRGITFPLYPELRIGPPTLSTYRDLQAFAPDVSHFIHPLIIGVPGMLMSKWMGVPTLASFHLDLSRMANHFKIGPLSLKFTQPYLRMLTRYSFNWADYALAPSKLIQQEMRDVGVREVGLWKRGVDAEKFNPCHRSSDMREQLSDGHPDDTLLIYVGRLSNEKQIDQIRAILERVPGTRLAVVGDGPARESLEKHFAGTKTKFMGYMTGAPLYSAYASADIFVFPSAMETFGLVVVEAMAAGLPVVSSRVGGVMDVVETGKTGYTFDVNDIDAMVDGVRQIATSRAHIEQMGRDARAFAETQTWPAMMDEVIEHYERLIENNKRRKHR